MCVYILLKRRYAAKHDIEIIRTYADPGIYFVVALLIHYYFYQQSRESEFPPTRDIW